jgi:hypothetical protein
MDTEGGAATLIVTPAGESVLIDSGNPGGRDSKRIFECATKAAGLKQIDHLITTHYHRDHFGGAAELANLMPIKMVHDNGEFKEGWERPSKEYLEFNAQRAVINPGDEISLKPSPSKNAPALHLKCLGARQQFISPPPGAKPTPDCDNPKRKPKDPSDNANSVVMVLSFGNFRFFDGGDLTWNVEEKLVCPVNLVGTVDVYQVTHHGLAISNNPLVVKALQPTVAVMSNGTTKGSEKETWETLRSVDSIHAVYQLHKNLRDDKESNTRDEFIANLEKDCPGNYVALSVEPDARSYTVKISATKHQRSFDVTTK